MGQLAKEVPGTVTRLSVIERWGQSTKKLGLVLNKSADTVSYLSREGVKRRLEDGDFADRYEVLDAEMVGSHKQTTAVAVDPH